MAKSDRNSVLSNFIWRFAERCGAQLVTFIVSIVLARILAPEDYGQIALITVFTTIIQVFVDSGLGLALIQKKDADDLDFSSVWSEKDGNIILTKKVRIPLAREGKISLAMRKQTIQRTKIEFAEGWQTRGT